MKTSSNLLYPRRLKAEEVYGTVFALIPLVGFLLFSIVPMIITFITMFYDMDGFRLGTMTWNNFANFATVFTDPLFGKSLLISLYVTTAHLIGLVLALIVSTLLAQKLRGSKFFMIVFFIPFICSTVAVSVMWLWMFDFNGIINSMYQILGGQPINWMNDPIAFTPMLIIVMVWQAPGYGIVMYSAAFTSTNPSVYEAAEIDGAGKWPQFWKITLPAISPTTFFLLLMGLINGLQTFDIARMFTGDVWTGAAGPEYTGLTTVLYIYNKGVMFSNMPIASVMSFVLFAIILAITLLNYKLANKWVSYD